MKEQFFGGGTDLHVNNAKNSPSISKDKQPTSMFLLDNPKMRKITSDNDHIIIGGSVTVEQFSCSPEIRSIIPNIEYFISKVSSKPIRNRATLSGNIVNASPIGDMTIMLLALDSSLTLKKNKVARQAALKDFYQGYKKISLKDGEMISSIEIRKDLKDYLFNFEKVSKRIYLDIASVNSAISIKVNKKTLLDIGISAGGVGPIPMFLKKASSYLSGKQISAEVIKAAADIADLEISPISDVRGSSQYKRLLLRQLIYAHFITLFPEINLEEGLI